MDVYMHLIKTLVVKCIFGYYYSITHYIGLNKSLHKSNIIMQPRKADEWFYIYFTIGKKAVTWSHTQLRI